MSMCQVSSVGMGTGVCPETVATSCLRKEDQCHEKRIVLQQTAEPGKFSSCKKPDLNLEALEEFKKFMQHKGLPQENIFLPVQIAPRDPRIPSPLFLRGVTSQSDVSQGGHGLDSGSQASKSELRAVASLGPLSRVSSHAWVCLVSTENCIPESD
ncbi:hypothetical protein MC885_007079 [Smutsia gigantea]|nr:hypothetical protein MC885_007079 [Smutsia gigantea]